MAKNIQKINVLIDTNILIRASMDSQTRSEMLFLIKLTKLKKVRLIISEIVMDELNKYRSNLEDSISAEISKVSVAIRELFKGLKIWNELEDLKDFIVNKLYEYQGEKCNESNNFIAQLENLIEKKQIKTIKPNAKQFYERQRQFTKGEMPLNISNDIHIMDFIKELCDKKKTETICFVTDNKKDFFETDQNGNYVRDEIGAYKIKDLIGAYGFINLKQITSFIEKQTGDINE